MNRSEAQDWFNRYSQGKLPTGELETFEKLLAKDEALRASFADWLHLEGVLKAEAEPLFLEDEAAQPAQVLRFPLGPRWMAAAAVLCLGLGALAGRSGLRQESTAVVAGNAVEPPAVAKTDPAPSPTVATLADTRACKWGAGSLPTAEGSRLAAGNLELLEGLATLRFDSGVTVTLEAPVVLEVVDAMKCRLLRGAAVAWVPDGAQGFRLDTPDALLTDYGTRFGVTANEDGTSQVLVLEGEVGVTHRQGSGERLLKTGEMVRYNSSRLLELEGDDAETPRSASRKAPLPPGWIALTTADGRGQDTCVRQGDGGAPLGGSPLIMVKNSKDFSSNRRKGYLRFDLASLAGREVLGAELVLSVQPSGLGYASVVPDATFQLYGLIDGPMDAQWDASTLKWGEAPANVPDDGVALDPALVVPLGEFVVEQGVSSGQRLVGSEALRDFLNADRDGLVTLILVRPTDETARDGLVHAFASREHPVAMPPTLRLKLE